MDPSLRTRCSHFCNSERASEASEVKGYPPGHPCYWRRSNIHGSFAALKMFPLLSFWTSERSERSEGVPSGSSMLDTTVAKFMDPSLRSGWQKWGWQNPFLSFWTRERSERSEEVPSGSSMLMTVVEYSWILRFAQDDKKEWPLSFFIVIPACFRRGSETETRINFLNTYLKPSSNYFKKMGSLEFPDSSCGINRHGSFASLRMTKKTGWQKRGMTKPFFVILNKRVKRAKWRIHANCDEI